MWGSENLGQRHLRAPPATAPRPTPPDPVASHRQVLQVGRRHHAGSKPLLGGAVQVQREGGERLRGAKGGVGGKEEPAKVSCVLYASMAAQVQGVRDQGLGAARVVPERERPSIQPNHTCLPLHPWWRTASWPVPP